MGQHFVQIMLTWPCYAIFALLLSAVFHARKSTISKEPANDRTIG